MRTIGEMLEWLKRHAWKACGLLKGLASSNLALSANLTALQNIRKAVFVSLKKEPAIRGSLANNK